MKKKVYRILLTDIIKKSSDAYKSYLAFTLAEVLIVIGIIGIVAQMTIPALVHDYKNEIYRQKAKKVASTLQQAALTFYNDNGGDITGKFANISSLGDDFTKNLKYGKKCNANDAAGTGKCLPDVRKHLNGTTCGWNAAYLNGADVGYILSDGTHIVFYGTNTNVSTCNLGTTGNCSNIFIDTNGYDAPNQFGYDAFLIPLGKTKLQMFSDSVGSGLTCIYPPGTGWNLAANDGYNCIGTLIMGNKVN